MHLSRISSASAARSGKKSPGGFWDALIHQSTSTDSCSSAQGSFRETPPLLKRQQDFDIVRASS
jgi:hypothetical protein